MQTLRARIAQMYTKEGSRGPVVTLLSGTAATLVISYLALPVLTRLFTDEAFGVSDYFVTIVSVLAAFAAFRYDDAVMLPDDDRKAYAVLWLTGALSMGTVALVAIASLWSEEIAALLGLPEIAPWLWLVAPVLLLIRFARLAESWLTRKRAFRTITGAEATNKLGILASRIGLGATTNLGAVGLIGGFIVGQAAWAAWFAAALLRRAETARAWRPSIRELRSVAGRYRRFPLYATPSSLLNTVLGRLPVLLLPVYFGWDATGLYGRAFAALAIPLSFIGTAVAQVFFVDGAQAYRENRLAGFTKNVHARLVMVGMFPCMLLIAAGPELFAFVFGANWRVAGVYEQYLACWFFLSAVASPLTRLFDILELQRAELAISIGSFLLLGAALVWGGATGNILFAMGLMAIAGSAGRIFQLGAMLKYAGVSLRDAASAYVRYALIALPLVACVWLTRGIWPTWAVGLAAMAAGAAYFGFVAWREKIWPGANMPPSASEQRDISE